MRYEVGCAEKQYETYATLHACARPTKVNLFKSQVIQKSNCSEVNFFEKQYETYATLHESAPNVTERERGGEEESEGERKRKGGGEIKRRERGKEERERGR